MLLTCPTCRSGLQVPDGTTAHVRCPTCRTVFSPAEGAAPPPPAPQPPLPRPPLPAPPRPPKPALPLDDEDDHRPRKRARRDDDDEDDDDRPRRRRRDDDQDEERPRKKASRDDRTDRRDGIGDADEKPRKKRRRRFDEDEDDKLSPEEKRKRAAAFARGMWAARLIAWGLLCQILAMVIILGAFIQAAITKEVAPGLFVLAGVLGLVNWGLGATGTGLSLAGPVSPGIYRYGVTAAVLVFVHAVLLSVTLARHESDTIGGTKDLPRAAMQWAQVPTQFHKLAFYMAYAGYHDRFPVGESVMVLSFVTGVVEMCRLMLIMLTLKCLARAAGDVETVYRCVRASGVVSIGPGAMALAVLGFFIAVMETGAEGQTWAAIVALVMVMGIFAVIAGILMVAMTAAKDVAFACEFPFQTQQVTFGA